MQPIDTDDFLAEKKDDIIAIEQHLQSRKKQQMDFQRLPFHKRRRTGSYCPKRRRNRKRQNENWTFLHRYFAKRFNMVKIQNKSFPLTRNQKSAGLSHKGHSFLFLTGLNCYIFYENDFHSIFEKNLEICDTEFDFIKSRNHYNQYRSVDSNSRFKKFPLILKRKKHLFMFTFDELDEITRNKAIFHSENVFQVLKPQEELHEGVSLIKHVKKIKEIDISEFLESNEKENSFILTLIQDLPFLVLFSENSKICTQYLTYNYFLISIDEYVRICHDILIVPLFYSTENIFRTYEDAIEENNCKKWWRTPTGKRHPLLKFSENNQHNDILENKTMYFDKLSESARIFPFKLPKLCFKSVYQFKIDSGTLEKGSTVYFKNDNERIHIGYVIYGQFSYRHGLYIGTFLIFNKFSDEKLENNLLCAVSLHSGKEIKLNLM
ncbi:putative POPLD, Ribonuclease P/MRP, subunit POP1 protein [Pseudoloma neurophilia]|uniref:Putative POPLD, Ribonuclease P/MRP, subunit POP1 protein n=1 Tax=Pseudoloma neurophilia TaxID=146866 RepID=A0A0R0M1V2_9MICR|nr:putative POPLD, Ribonuclease P/MRP, subunit POP1 protein [Pseudoloma neurophilia]